MSVRSPHDASARLHYDPTLTNDRIFTQLQKIYKCYRKNCVVQMLKNKLRDSV